MLVDPNHVGRKGGGRPHTQDNTHWALHLLAASLAPNVEPNVSAYSLTCYGTDGTALGVAKPSALAMILAARPGYQGGSECRISRATTLRKRGGLGRQLASNDDATSRCHWVGAVACGAAACQGAPPGPAPGGGAFPNPAGGSCRAPLPT